MTRETQMVLKEAEEILSKIKGKHRLYGELKLTGLKPDKHKKIKNVVEKKTN